MNKEYSTSHQMGNFPKGIIILMLGFFPFLGSILFFLSIYVLYSSYILDGYPLGYSCASFAFVMLVSIFCHLIGWAFISRGLAKYRFADNGLIAIFPLRRDEIIPWECFQQICVCYAAYTTRGERRANTVICCIKKGETRNGLGRWKTDNPFRYRSVICIEYNDALLNGLIEKCPDTVVDLRNTPEYRL